MVVRKSNPDRFCVVHAHPKKEGSTTDQAPGAEIKCYSVATYGAAGAEKRALAMHEAIQISQAKQGGEA